MANRTVTDLARFREQLTENAGGLSVNFQLSYTDPATGQPRTETFVVPNPIVAEQHVEDGIKAATTDVDIAKAIINTPTDDQIFERFKLAGGRANDIVGAWRAMQDELGRPGALSLPKADSDSQ